MRKDFLLHNLPIMKTLTNLFSLVDVESISKYMNIGLTIALIAVLAILVLIFLRGLLRGWKYGTYRIIAFAILLTVVLTTLGVQASAIGNINIEGLGLQTSFSLTIDGTEKTIAVVWRSLQSGLEDLFIQLADAFGASRDSYSGIMAYATVMATSLIKLLLLFVWGIILSTLGLLIIMLLWHIIFKRFIPKDKRKIKKLRIVSAFEELLIGAACLGMLLSPFTGIANALAYNANIDKDSQTYKENETVSMITDLLGVYKESAFAKTFFSWNAMDGTTTFSQSLVSFLTQSEAGELKTDVVSELSYVASFSSKLVNSGLLSSMGSEGIRWYLLLNCASIPELFYSLADSKLLTSAFPFAVTLASHMDAVKEVLGEETCKWLSDYNADWSKTAMKLGQVYQNILDSGVIDCVVDSESSTPEFDITQLKYVFSGKDVNGNDRDSKTAMHNLAKNIEDSTLFNHLIAGLLSQLGQQELDSEEKADLSLLDFLPLKEDGTISYEDLVDINYSNEFLIIYDTMYSLNEKAPDLVDDLFGLFKSDDGQETSESERYRALVADAALKADDIVTLIVGERDSNGDPKKGSASCLLDSVLIDNALPSMVNIIEKSGSYVLDMDFEIPLTKATLHTEEGFKKEYLNAYKKEFGAALDVAADFASSEEGYLFIKDGTGLAHDEDGNLIYIDPNLVKAMQRSLSVSDSSIMMSEALPQVAEHYLTDFMGTLADYGIQKVDYHCANFGTELGKLLDLVSYSGDMLLALTRVAETSTYTAASLLLENKDNLLNILDVFASSKILNPEIDGMKNVNFCSLLNNVFEKAGLEGWEVSYEMLDGLTLESVRDGEGNVVTENENGRIVDFIMSLSEVMPLSDLLSLGSASNSETMRILSQIDIEKVFASIGESAVISAIAGPGMDRYFASMVGYDQGGDISFKNVTDWAKEGQVIQKLLNLAINGIDVSNFNMNNVSPTVASDLFESLASSSIFLKANEDGGEDYLFPTYFSNKILSMADDDTIAYFADDGKSIKSSASLEEKQSACSLFVSNCKELDTPDKWTADDGEIAIFADVLGDIQAIGGFSSISSFSRSKLPLIRDLMTSLARSSAFGQVLLGNALEQSLSSLGSSDSFDMSLANASVFFSDEFKDVATRESEVAVLCDVMYTLFDANYGLFDEDGKLDESKMKLSSISVDYCLEPLFRDIAESKVLSTPKEKDGDTLLKSVFRSLLVKSNLYGDGLTENDPISVYAPNVTIASIVSDVNKSGKMSEEIKTFCNVLRLIKENGLLSGDSLSISSLDSSYSGTLNELLSQINSSDLLYRCLPIQIEKAVSSIDLQQEKFKNDLKLCDPYVMRNDEGTDYGRYDDNEIACVATLLTSVSSFSKLDFSSISSLADADPTALLSPLYASQIFNKTAGPEGYTSAQSFLIDIIDEMGLDDNLYSESSPKDSRVDEDGQRLYTSAEEKIRWLVDTHLGKGDEGNYSAYTLEKQEEDGNAFKEVIGNGEGGLSRFLSNLKEDGIASSLSEGDIDFKNLSYVTLSSLLKDLSSCTLLSDVPMNALTSYLQGDDLKISDEVDLTLTNTYYPYEYDVYGNKLAEPDYDRSYDDSEIDLLVDLLSLIDENKDGLSEKKVDSLNPYSLRQLMNELSDSLLFERTGPNKHSDSYGKGWSNGKYTSGTYVSGETTKATRVTSDLTVFKQIMYMVYDTSGLAERAFDEYRDFSYLVDAGNDAKLASELKLHDKITALSSWGEEIEALTTNNKGDSGLIQIAQTSDLTSGGKVSMSSGDLNGLTPGKIIKLLVSLGKSEVCSDALGKTLSSFLTSGEGSSKGLGVENFSAYTAKYADNNTTFSSSSTFLAHKIKYDKVVFTSSSFVGTEASSFELYGDLDGDGVIDDSLNAYVSISADAYETATSSWVIDTSKLGCDFKVVSPISASISYSFDTANYYSSFEEGGANATSLEYLLCSLRKSDDTYYSFEGSGSTLESALKDNIGLYGIASIVFDSDFYSSSYFDADFSPVNGDKAAFSSRSLSLYQMLSFTPSAFSGLDVEVKLLDAIDEPALKNKYGSDIKLSSRLASIEALMETKTDTFAESAFLEESLLGLALSNGVHEAIETASSSAASAYSYSYRYLSSMLTGHSSSSGSKSNGDYYDDFLNSSEVTYSYYIDNKEGKTETKSGKDATSVLAKPLIAGALNDRVSERLSYAELSSHVKSSPSKGDSSRLVYLSSDDQKSLASFDAYGYDSSAGTYSYDGLKELSQNEIKAMRFEELVKTGVNLTSGSLTPSSDYSDYQLNDAQKTELLGESGTGGICDDFDNLNGKSRSYVNLAYLADFYDFLVLKGEACAALGCDYFFHAANSLLSLLATDFPSTFENGVCKGGDKKFSYRNVASTLLYA